MTVLKKKSIVKPISSWIVLICVYFLSLNLALKTLLPQVTYAIEKNIKKFIHYQQIDIKIFPYPGIELKNLSIMIKNNISISTKQLDIFINFLGIPEKFLGIRGYDGEVFIGDLKFNDKKDKKPFTLPKIPVEFVELNNFKLNTNLKKIPVNFQNIYAYILQDKDKIKIKSSGNSNLSKEFTLDTTITNAEKNIQAQLSDLNLNTLAKFLPQNYEKLKEISGKINTVVDINLNGQVIEAKLDLESNKIILGEKITGLTSKLEASLDSSKNIYSILIKNFNASYPKIHLAGNVEIIKGKVKTLLTSTEINISQILTFYEKFPIKHNIIDEIKSIVKGGKLYSGEFNLIHANNHTDWELLGQCRDTEILIPNIQLPLQKLSGKLTIKNNVLQSRDVSGYYKNSKIINGYLDLGLNKDLTPFVIKTNVDFDLHDLTPLLKNLNVSDDVISKLDKIEIERGNCIGLFQLNKHNEKYLWEVVAKDIKTTGTLDKTPFYIHTDIFNLKPDKLLVTNGNIKLKKSNIKNLNLTSNLITKDIITNFTSTKINIKELKDVAKYLFSYENKFNIDGEVFLKSLEINYNLTKNQLINYFLNGSIYSLKLKGLNLAKDLPQNLSIFLSSGRFNILPKKIDFSNSNISMLNSRIKLHKLELIGNITDPHSIKFTLSGDISKDVQKIITNKISYLKPIKATNFIHAENLKIDIKKSDILINGKLILNEIDTDLHIEKNQDNIYSNIELIHKRKTCSISLTKQDKKYFIKFSGELSKDTLDRLLEENLYLKDKITGDFSINFSLNPFYITNSNGHINIASLTLDKQLNLSITKLMANSNNNKIIIKKSLISLFNDSLSLHGKINIIRDHNELYIKLKSDSLHLDPLIEKISNKSKSSVQLKLKGTVDFNISKTFYKKRIASDISGKIFLDNGFNKLKVYHGYICNLPINVVVIKEKEIYQINTSINSSCFLIQDTLSCLTPEKKELITGISNIKMDFHSNIDNFTKSLNGKFYFESKDGSIFKLTLLSQILTIINSTEIFFGKIPDLESNGFKYTDLKAIGKIKDGIIIFEPSYINGTNMELAFHGKINLNTKDINMIILFAPLKTVDRIVKKIPILKNITGGNLVVIPFQAKGTIDNPTIIPLSPKAVGSEVMGILKNTIKLPFTLFQPLLPNGE